MKMKGKISGEKALTGVQSDGATDSDYALTLNPRRHYFNTFNNNGDQWSNGELFSNV